MELTWITSSLSTNDDRVNCVEVAHLPDGGTAVRDSRDPGTQLNFTREEWDCFLGGARNGEFDRFAR